MTWFTSIEPPRAAADVWAYLVTEGFTGDRRLSIGLVDAAEVLMLEPAIVGGLGIDAGPVWIAQVLWGGGADAGHRTTVIVPDSAIDQRRRDLTVIVDGERVQPSYTIID